MNTTNTAETPAGSQRRVEITGADLPLHCPLDGERIWDAHPRVFIPIRRGDEARCPYCGTVYELPDK